MIERQLADVEAAEASPSSMAPGVSGDEGAGKPTTPEWLNSLARE
jgi:hypothetical protein